MKRYFLFLLTICVTFAVYAKKPFEGVMTLKTMESYSSKFIKLAPYLYSNADTCVIKIKGDNLHLYCKMKGLHKVLKNGRLYCWSDNSKTGFDMPSFSVESKKSDRIPTGATKKFGDISTHLYKNILDRDYYKTEEEGWIADEVPFGIDINVLNTIYFIISANQSYFGDIHDNLFIKYTGRLWAKAASERAIGVAVGAGVGNTSIAGSDNSQADNAATNEASMSFSFAVLSFTPSSLEDDDFVIPTDVNFVTQKDTPTTRDYMYACTEIYPSMKSSLKTLERLGGNKGESLCDPLLFFQTREQILHVENKKALKKAKKLSEPKSKNVKAVIYDINEEWDF